MRSTTFLTLAAVVILSSVAHALPGVTGVSSPTTVGLYEKLEVTFNLSTVAANPYWPYDTNPNQGVPAALGVTADALFSRDNWQTTIVQPAFYYQPYRRDAYLYNQSRGDWLYPTGDPCWKVRFAPTAKGDWKFKLRVTDASGTTTTSEYSFSCTDSTNHGFVRVSPKDTRYFEASDGHYLNMVALSDDRPNTYAMDSRYALYNANGVNLIRPWWNGSQSPIVFGIGGQGGIPNWDGLFLTGESARPGKLFSGLRISSTPLVNGADVKPDTAYRFSIFVKTVGGFNGQIRLSCFDCVESSQPLSETVTGDTDWKEISGVLHSKSNQYHFDFLTVNVSGLTTGKAYFSDMSLREVYANGSYGPELMTSTNINPQYTYAQRDMWIADYQTECAKQNGIYLKVCLMEKDDQAFSKIRADGTVGVSDNNNFYASKTHACRTYQQYFWRYIIARYGYATSIHSFEFCNEGDPFNGNHYDGVQAMARYFRDNDPSHHLITTSFWHSFPSEQFWANSTYPDLGYADWHQYIGDGDDGSGWGLQRYYGWQKASPGIENAVYRQTLSSTVFRSAPNSLYIHSDTGQDLHAESFPIAITPGHTYTAKCYIKGSGLTTTGSTHPDWAIPNIMMAFKSGWWYGGINTASSKEKYFGTYDWTPISITAIAPANAKYIVLQPGIGYTVGDLWIDDITIHDDTANEDVFVPGGDFDVNRLDLDSAAITQSMGTQIGARTSHVVPFPVIRGECGITGPVEGLVDQDSEGVWYRKYVWGQINQYGVIDMYWWIDSIVDKGFLKYAHAYQAFMSDIPLSNGNYRDIAATVSNHSIRAWGQKDPGTDRAHVWIDNIPYNWKNVVDGVQVPAVTGVVSVPGFKNGSYRIEWWDTSAGTVLRTEDYNCTDGTVRLQVTELKSDIACKISPVSPSVTLKVMVPAESVVPGQTVTVTVEYTNTGIAEASNVAVRARVPAEMDYVAGSGEATGGSWDANTQTVSWTVPTVAPGATGSRTFKAKVR